MSRLLLKEFLPGKRFGRWEVLEFFELNKHDQTCFLCLCDCGQLKIVAGFTLKNKVSGSCGCLIREKLALASITHGLTESPEYKSWTNMITRCTNPKSNRYKYYGERGITVCERWRLFENFYADMGKRPKGKSLDRINNDGNYEPLNCRWATFKEQMNNRSNSKKGKSYENAKTPVGQIFRKT